MFKSYLLFISSFLLFGKLHIVTASSFSCEVLRYSSVLQINREKLITTDTIVYKINTRMGEEYTRVSLPYSSINALTGMDAWIEDDRGDVVRKLRRQDITDVSAKESSTLFQDKFLKKYALRYNEYPYLLYVTYQYTARNFIEIADWNPVVRLDIPTRQAVLRLTIPDNYKVQILEKNIDKAFTDTTDGMIIYSWYSEYNGKFKNELFSPEFRSFLPLIKIIPEKFVFDTEGQSSSWQTFGNWQYDLIRGLTNLPENEIMKVKSLISNTLTKSEIIRILYHYLQDNTRYINVSIKTGGLKPFPAAYVAEKKYGDCKALTIYMKALLDVFGIDSYYTIVNAAFQPPDFIRELPSLQFNHVILAVPCEEDTLWLENTSNNNPFGYAGTFIQNRYALLVDSNASRIVSIPALQKEDVLCSKNYKFTLGTSGNTDLIMSNFYRGSDFEMFNELQKYYTSSEQNEILYELIPYADLKILFWQLIHSGRDARLIHLIAQATHKTIMNDLGNEQYFSIAPIELPPFEQAVNRTLPVRLPCPVYLSDTLSYSLNLSFSKMNVPADTLIENRFGNYRLRFVKDDNNLLVYREFYLKAGFIPYSDYPNFYAFLTAVKELEKKKIIITL